MTIITPKRTEAEVEAVRAVIAGVASKDQQMRAMDWIMDQACNITDVSYTGKEEPLAMAFGEGRRYVGAQIRAMLTPLALEIAKKQSKPRGTAK